MASGQRLQFKEAILLIANQDKRKSDDARLAKDRTRKRIQRAIESGDLVQQDDKTISHDDLMEWAAGKFRNIPAPSRMSGTIDTFSCEMVGGSVPATCEEAMKMCEDLQVKLVEARIEIFELRPDAEKWRAWNATKRKSR